MIWKNIAFLFILFTVLTSVNSALYPYETELREIKSLNGLWDFWIYQDSKFNHRKVQAEDFLNSSLLLNEDHFKMAVPSSFQDVLTSGSVRNHVGWIIYKRDFYLPTLWFKYGRGIFVNFGSVHYRCYVFVNDIKLFEHVGGHIPFEVNITSVAKPHLNNITVVVNTTLTNTSLPQGRFKTEYQRDGFTLNKYTLNCDYFDYAGINRPVTIVSPYSLNFIRDISIKTDYLGDKGFVKYNVTIYKVYEFDIDCFVQIYDKERKLVAKSKNCTGLITIDDVKLWWPIMSNDQSEPPGYLYTFEVRTNEDVYRLPFGIRTISWNDKSILVNGVPVYLRGVGMHEDSEIRGRGFDNAVLMRDLSLMKWLGINSFRTSHYPYSDELLNEADELGFLVILETPACSLDNFGKEIYDEHLRVLREIMDHHKNRPSVLMWSLANEPQTNLNTSESYFRNLISETHKKDDSRPVTFVTSQSLQNDKAVKYVDVVCLNRYYGWYQLQGEVCDEPGPKLDNVQMAILLEITDGRKNISKPFIITEYGAGSYVGQHSIPSTMWSEEYQTRLLEDHFVIFDHLRHSLFGDFFIGEMIWNFIDFKVSQEYFRPGICGKGLFTRDRQPKKAAFAVRKRYHELHHLTKIKKRCSSKSSEFRESYSGYSSGISLIN